MKKVICLTLCLLLLVAFSGCVLPGMGGETETTSSTSDVNGGNETDPSGNDTDSNNDATETTAPGDDTTEPKDTTSDDGGIELPPVWLD